MEKRSRKLMYLLGGGLAFGVILGAAAFVSVKGPSIASPFYGTEVEPKTLTLGVGSIGLDKQGYPLPDAPSRTAQDFALGGYQNTTIRTSWATKKDDMILRLNSTDGDPSYLEKVEPCYGMTSITINLNSGNVEILTGYEYGVWTHRYVSNPDKTEKTFSVEGNYFRIENVSSNNALIKSFKVTYGCLKEAKYASPSPYSMEVADSPSVVTGKPGRWFYHNNGGWHVQESPKPLVENNSFTSEITSIDPENTQGAWYRYQPVTVDGLTSDYRISLNITLNVNGSVARNNSLNPVSVVADTPARFVSDKNNTSPFYLKVYGIGAMPAEGNITVEVTNICIYRYIA